MSDHFPWVRIVIVAYNSAGHLQRCVDSLEEQAFRSFEVVIVDNQCPEKSTDSLRLPDARFRVIRANENLGFAAGTNFGAIDAQTEWVLALNPDTFASADWLQNLFNASQENPGFDMLGTTLLQAENPEIVDGFGDVLSIYGFCWRGGHGIHESSLPDRHCEVFGACGAAACYRRTFFERLKGFDEAYFCYLEDVDISFRFQLLNCKCLQVRDALVWHVGGASSAGSDGFAVYQTYKNSLRLILANARPLMLMPIVFLFVCAQVYTLLRNWRSPHTSDRLRGLRSGFRSIPAALKQRRMVQSDAAAGSWAICSRLAWSPSGLKRQSISILVSAQNGH